MSEPGEGQPKEEHKGALEQVISRRTFLKGAAGLAVGLAAAGAASRLRHLPSPPDAIASADAEQGTELGEKMPFEAVGFSDEEGKILSEYYKRAVTYFQTRYGPDIFQARYGPNPSDIGDRKVIFRKIAASEKKGHGPYTFAHFPPGSDGSTAEFQITEILGLNGQVIGKALRDVGHEMSHLWVTQNIVLGRNEDKQMQQMYKPLSEGLAELDAYNLDEAKNPPGTYDVGYYRSEEGRLLRQDSKLFTQPFAGNIEYFIVSAALLELENRYPNLARTVIETFKRRNQIDDATNQRYSPGILAIVEEVHGLYAQQGLPGFKDALAKEPALRYQPPQPPSHL